MSENGFYCHNLPTKPNPEMGLVLVTGAGGYIGGRVVPELIERGYRVRVMVRKHPEAMRERWPNVEVVVADLLDYSSLIVALEGVHTAYYFIHSLMKGPHKFVEYDRRAAVNFREAAEVQNVQRIIYLSGLGGRYAKHASHLNNRMMVGKTINEGRVPMTILRAGIVIGSGSASFEIIKNLVKNSPIFLMPRWTRNNIQPISIRDVVRYLVGVLEIPETAGNAYDIGGSEILTYEKMIRILAEIVEKKPLILKSPFSNIPFYAYIASLMTPVPAAIIKSLMGSIDNTVVCQDKELPKLLPFETLSYKDALLKAISSEAQDKVYSRWTDSYPSFHENAMKLSEAGVPRYASSYSLRTLKPATSLFYSICRVGGEEGWFRNHWMWMLRGVADRLMFGVGISRGRRTTSHLRADDVIDFWRVEEIIKDRRLLLRAEMKLPGRAWLELAVQDKENFRELVVNAYFHPFGIFGHLYWFVFLPSHRIIFPDLIRQIEKRSRKEDRDSILVAEAESSQIE